MRVGIWIIILCLCISDVELVFKWKKQAASYFSNDGMSMEQKQKIMALALEFIYKMQLLQRQLLPIKLIHVNKMAYQLGLVIGTMREKYKRMMDVYNDIMRKVQGKSRILGYGVWDVYTNMHYMIGMETIRMLEVEIHKYVDLLLKIPEKDLDELSEIKKHQLPAEGLPPVLRQHSNKTAVRNIAAAGTSSFAQESKEVMNNEKAVETEEDVKRKYRESYMRQNGWKGDEWSLDQHYGFV